MINGKANVFQPSRLSGRYAVLALTLASGAFLAGCAHAPKKAPKIPPITAVDRAIAEAVTTSSNANQAIAEVEVATAAPKRPGPGATLPPGVKMPSELAQDMTIDWQGRIEPLLEAIAERIGYRFTVIGRAPANPVIISVTAKDESVANLVRRVGNLIHDHGDVVLNPRSRNIELRYGS